jgi:hypothetical protein
MWLQIDRLVGSLDSDAKKVRLLINNLPDVVSDDGLSVNMAGTLAVLVFDFLLLIGKQVEDALPIVQEFMLPIGVYAEHLESGLDSNARVLPAFMTILDNRFVTMDFAQPVVSAYHYGGVFDSETGAKHTEVRVPPVCSLSLSLPAMYLSSVAMFTPHQAVAQAYKEGRLALRSI